MGSVLALVVAAQLPDALEPVVPDPTERSAVVADVVEGANPQAVPSVIGAQPATTGYDRPEVVAAADSVFVDGIRAAELVGFVLVLGALGFGWYGFPRSGGSERADELAEAAALEPADRA